MEAQYDYDPYGNRVVLSGMMDIDFGYTGHYHHAPSGLNLTLYRAYNPALGRWISRDPIGERGGINLYGYVDNDPVNLFDPFGLTDWGPVETQMLLRRAYRDATEGPIQGLLNIKANSQGDYDFKDTGDTFCVNGNRMSDAAFSNYAAGFAGRAYDSAFGGHLALGFCASIRY